MKAILCTQYGEPELLQIQDVPKPEPKEKEVLIRVVTTAINDYDWSMVRGKPYLYRSFFGISKPKRSIPGMEVAGIIEALGPNTSSFNIGDAVYGDISDYGFGSFAEYLSINENALVKKPQTMPFEDATTLPHAALLALQGLDLGQLKKGQKILLNGAGGGVGTFAFQLAKLQGCEVIGVDTGEKLSLMKAMGFDQVIDYKKRDFTRNNETYDLILDCKTNRNPFAYIRALKHEGRYVTVGGKVQRLIQMLIFKKLIALFYNKKFAILSLKPNKGLDTINKLYEEGKLKCIVDGPHPFSEIPKRIAYFGRGEHYGKVVIGVPTKPDAL